MIAEFYPRAWEHLEAARRAKADLASSWDSLLAADLADFSVVNHPDGSGRLVAHANWPDGARSQLTSRFESCVKELWACLDALIVESVSMFSILKRPRNPDAPRYFPIADSSENFEALLAESCLDGILQLQFDMIRDCQPFQSQPEDERIERFRSGLRQLLDWSNRIEEGSRVGAWVTPVEPQVHVEEPARLVRLEVQAPGELDDERVVARYRVINRAPDASVVGQAGTYVDLAFPDGFTPIDADDTFDRRVRSVIDIVARFAVSFAWLAGRAPGTKRVILGTGADAAETWVEASWSPRRWTEEELGTLAASELGVGVVQETDQLILIVATPDGVYERLIPDATPLRQHIVRGTAAERAAQEAAATWGLPDFVVRPHVERKGPGVREISDGLLVVGDRGAIIQVKNRDIDPTDPAREARWLDKQIGGATRQANGTARRLSAKTTEMTNGRGRKILIDGAAIDWVAAIIIEHPDPPASYRVPRIESRIPSVVLMRHEWEFLFNQLRSSRAVVDYLHRVGGSTEYFGTEPIRYYELAAADLAAAAQPVGPASEHEWRNGERRSVPLLPTAPAGTDDDEAHGIVRMMCEDIATSPLEGQREEDRLKVLALIDQLPVGHRSDLGRLLLSGLQAARQTDPESTTWRFRTFRPTTSQGVQLGFGICSNLSEATRNAFRSWFLLRHHERSEVEPLTAATSVGVLLTPRHDGYRDWDTTMIAITGDPQLTSDELSQGRRVWNGRQATGTTATDVQER